MKKLFPLFVVVLAVLVGLQLGGIVTKSFSRVLVDMGAAQAK